MLVMTMKKLLLTILLLLLPCVSFGEGISLFATDGCSVFPDGTPAHKSLWAHCCIAHDIAYWQGGTYDQRLAADKQLEQCVAQVGEPEIAQFMLAGVRVGGSPYFPTSYRWGYGWPYPRGYKALTKDEIKQVQQSLQSLELLIKSILQQLSDR